jgi:hypothetical protein
LFGRLAVGLNRYSGDDTVARMADIGAGFEIPLRDDDRLAVCPGLTYNLESGRTLESRTEGPEDTRVLEPSLSIGALRPVGNVGAVFSIGVGYFRKQTTVNRVFPLGETDQTSEQGAVVTLSVGILPTRRVGVTASARLPLDGRDTVKVISISATMGLGK